jgi:predicted MPP superfamily phosphohydrolase
MKITRRQFIRATYTLGFAGFGYSALVEPRWVEIRRVRVPIHKLPHAFEGLTIAQLSDLHRSTVVSAAYLEHCVQLANALQPDVMVFTGDYLTHALKGSLKGRLVYDASFYDPHDLAPELLRNVAKVIGGARAKLGVFAVLGNHDHWYDGNAVTLALQAAGVTVLRNGAAEVRVGGETLPVVGLGDVWTDGADCRRAFAGVNAPFTLTLMHNPDVFEHWPQPGAHLILAGHTHGGQVRLPLAGAPFVPSRYGQKYANGLCRRGDAVMYVNRGVGHLFPPLRFNCRPEISFFQLASG